MRRVIVTAGIGPHYAGRMDMQERQLERWCPDVPRRVWREYPEGCPPHSATAMYRFKLDLIQRAIDEGFTTVLWIDSVFAPVGKMWPLWDHLVDVGWYVPPQLNEPMSRWCSDAALARFEITREDAAAIPLVYSGLVGLNLNTDEGLSILNRWRHWMDAGTFEGAHRNIPFEPLREWGNKWEGHCSADLRVQGHRHDESALSYVLHERGLRPEHLGFLSDTTPETGFIGMHLYRHQGVA